MLVTKLMSSHPVTVAPSADLEQAIALMEEHDVRHLPVLHKGELRGVISDRDLLDATGWLHPRQRQVLEAPDGDVGDFMSAPAHSVSVADPVQVALGLMVQARVGCLPVVDGDDVVGVITEMDVLKGFLHARRIGRLPGDCEVRVTELMTKDPGVIAPDAGGSDAAGMLASLGVRHLPVLDGEKLVGILSDRDIRRFRGEGALEVALVKDMMTPRPDRLAPNHTLSDAAVILSSQKIGAAPVTDDDRLVGIVSLIDVMVPCAQALQQVR